MLQARNLDDQRFDEIVSAAIGKLPWLCPDWTDHNAHDPGVTILELLAWYKEMQQYHMNRFTDDMRRKLLALVGVRCREASAAVCYVQPSAQTRDCPRLTRLETPEEIVFELENSMPQEGPQIACCLVGGQGRWTDVTALMENLKISVTPFHYNEEQTSLFIGFAGQPREQLRLWFDIDEPEVCPRNPFTAADQMPRELAWQLPGGQPITILEDDTHALSQDGFITFRLPEDWTPSEENGQTLYWLQASLVRPGCEDEVRLCGISARYYKAIQRETWSEPRWLQVPAKQDHTLTFDDALSLDGEFTVFGRTEEGWQQYTQLALGYERAGRTVTLDTSAVLTDGEDNLLVVASDPIHYRELFFDSDGLPDQTIDLRLGGRQALPSELVLVCDTLCEDGGIRPQLWRCAEDFFAAGPRSRVFTYDPDRETITFGDGARGAIVPRGKNAVFAAGLRLSRCGAGNIPVQSPLQCAGVRVTHTPASGGADQESLGAASARLLRLMQQPQRCVSAGDYERLALQTPGLRVRAVRVIPGYDPDAASSGGDRPVITLVAIPWGSNSRPMPDESFLRRVRDQVEAHRPVCTVLRVVAPTYVPISAAVQIKTSGSVTRDTIYAAIEAHLAIGGGRQIGDRISRNDLAAAIQAVPGVLQVSRLELRSVSPDCFINAAGDGLLPQTGVPYLKTLDLETA